MSRLPRREVQTINLRGGIDLASTFLNVDPGAAIDLINYEPELEGGYRRIAGYERVDGRPLPSSARYYTVGVADASGIAIGSTLTGGTSGATSKVVVKDGNTLGVTALTGSYTLAESANGTTITAVQSLSGQSNIETDEDWQLAAENYYRDQIDPIPGDGNSLYAFQLGATKYAFRADAGAVKLYKSSASGWTLVPYYSVLFFDGGVLADGDIQASTAIAGATSGATATVKRFIKNGGDYESDASGYMIIEATGTFQDNEDIEVGGVPKASANGASAPITMSPGGKFQHLQRNFYGSSATQRIYGCDGVNPAWEFDGDILTPIYPPEPNQAASWNKPTFVAVFRTYLFLGYETGQVARSAPGEPLIFSGLMGADEFGLGSPITGMEERAADVLALYTQNKTYGLYGTSASNFQLRVISETYGAKPYTVQKVGGVYAMDEKGIAPLNRVDAYGDFEAATLSRKVIPIIRQYRDRVVGSVSVKDRNQYRLIFDDGSGLIMGDDQYLGESLPDFTRIQYAHVPTFISESEDENGNQVILFGDKDGYIYQAESGYNFDGDPIDYTFRTPAIHQGAPSIRKGYKRAYFDLDTPQVVTLRVAYDLGYGSPRIPSSVGADLLTEAGGSFWNVGNWDEFYWDGPTANSKGIPLVGTSNNISFLVFGSSNKVRPFTIQTLEIHYIPRRLRRE